MNSVIERIYATKKVEMPGGETRDLDSAIDPQEGRFLQSLIEDDSTVRRTLEVGCAYGLSSMCICEATKSRPGARHTIIDPFQNSEWEGVGIANLKASGLTAFELIEEKSEFALPQLVQAGEEAFDFIFIDGFHTFDHTMVDCFYATRLLRAGGYLVVDDVSHPSVRRVVDYLANYPCYETLRAVSNPRRRSTARRLAQFARLALIPLGQDLQQKLFTRSFRRLCFDSEKESMVALKKVVGDDRPWNWFSGDF